MQLGSVAIPTGTTNLHQQQPLPPAAKRCIYFGLLVIVLVTVRKLLFVCGVPVPVRLISQLGGFVSFVFLVLGMWMLNRVTGVGLIRPSHLWLARTWQVLLIALFLYGMARGNSVSIAGKEFIALWFFSATWLAGTNNEFWIAITKALTIIFYASLPLIFFSTDIVAPVTTYSGTSEAEYQYIGVRRTNTLAYEFRPLIGSGMFLGVWGLVQPKGGKWRTLQIAAFALAFAIQVGVFKFRSSAGFFLLAGASALVVRPIIERRVRIAFLVSIVIAFSVGLGAFFMTEASNVLLNRIANPDGNSMFTSRIAELQSYIESIGLEMAVGRGLGGHYNAQAAIGTDHAANWHTVHLGLLVFTLKGGLPLLTIFMLVLASGFLPRPRSWLMHPCNMAAMALLPVMVLQFCLVPFGLSPMSSISYLPPMMAMARFGRTNNPE
ncbi:hypothetical protein Pan14r_28280 [Crateriforma conspicua]|uniref:O-Antigen ligase n=2 Tax=Crateriforma conspicua TaxID=2527996 RepID=A0A5C5Y7R4_9PLAN|nr:hypothetical protein Pan14r_28280 [Crateriforma conspicua]